MPGTPLANPQYRLAADAGDPRAMWRLGGLLHDAGDPVGAERWYRQAAAAGNTYAMLDLMWIREKTGDPHRAERYAEQAAAAGEASGFTSLAWMRSNDGAEAERLRQRAVDAGDRDALVQRVWLLEIRNEQAKVDHLYDQIVERGDGSTLIRLAEQFKYTRRATAKALCMRAATELGNWVAMCHLASTYADTPDEAEHYYARQAANAGELTPFGVWADKCLPVAERERLKRYGLEPDGTTAREWE